MQYKTYYISEDFLKNKEEIGAITQKIFLTNKSFLIELIGVMSVHRILCNLQNMFPEKIEKTALNVGKNPTAAIQAMHLKYTNIQFSSEISKQLSEILSSFKN